MFVPSCVSTQWLVLLPRIFCAACINRNLAADGAIQLDLSHPIWWQKIKISFGLFSNQICHMYVYIYICTYEFVYIYIHIIIIRFEQK